MTAETVVYTASLSTQVTAACAALLVQQRRLNTEARLSEWMPELPAWASAVRVRHLIFHTSGLPEGIELDDLHRAGFDRTTDAVIDGLIRCDHPVSPPGIEYRYRNAGYVCLAVVVARAVRQPLADFAREHVFTPLGTIDSLFWDGPAPHPPGAAPVDRRDPALLSLGDGGLWSTPVELLRWNLATDRDELGISTLVQTSGHLDDGAALDYAWGVGVREQAGRQIYRHGGRWAGLSLQLVRLGQATSFVIVALDDDEDRTARLAGAVIRELTTEDSARSTQGSRRI